MQPHAQRGACDICLTAQVSGVNTPSQDASDHQNSHNMFLGAPYFKWHFFKLTNYCMNLHFSTHCIDWEGVRCGNKQCQYTFWFYMFYHWYSGSAPCYLQYVTLFHFSATSEAMPKLQRAKGLERFPCLVIFVVIICMTSMQEIPCKRRCTSDLPPTQ